VHQRLVASRFRVARFLLPVHGTAGRFLERLERLRDATAGELQLRRVEPALLEDVQEVLQLLLRLRRAGSLEQATRVEPALQRALQPAEVDVQRGLAEDARELIGAPGHQRLRERRHLQQQLCDLLELRLAELLRLERVEQRSLQPLDQVLRAGEVQLEEPVEHRRILPALHQRGAQRAAKRRAVLHAHEQRCLRRVGHFRRRDAQAVLPQQPGEVLEALFHLAHGSLPRMWMLALLAGALLERGRPALEAVRPQAISATVRFLSDDLLEGRGTGTRGHALAEQYVASQMQGLGLRPAGEAGYLQRVPLCEAKADGTLFIDNVELTQVLVAGDCGPPQRTVEGDLAFAGYGQAQEIKDVRGKIAVVLAGAPAELPSTQRALASSNEEKLKRLKAAGAVAEIVLTTPEVEARRPWTLLQRNFLNGQAYVADDLPPMPLLYVGLAESEKLRKHLGRRARLRLSQTTRRFESNNVAGLLPGSSPETIVYSAHLDHHGICAPGEQDPICNGAIDNATGIAEMLEIARGFSALPNRERSVLFVAVTGEERGLLGSAWYSRHPTVPREQMIANLNLDQLLPAVPVRELVLRGAELSTLEDHVRAAAGELGLAIAPDPVPEQAFFARSDQLNFARIGVPSACLWQGFAGPAGEAAFKEFRAHRYHQPSDEWLPTYDWEAAAQMARAELLVGISLLSGPRPQWKPDSPFR